MSTQDLSGGGYPKIYGGVPDAIAKLEELMRVVSKQISVRSEAELTVKPDAMRWSQKEILGHLIDSALNNLKRFTEASFAETLPFAEQAYDQVNLVAANGYQDVPMPELLTLLEALNRQIIFVVRRWNAKKFSVPVVLSNGAVQTLGWLVEDYVAHFEHHLKQLDLTVQP